ncbi:hypothetical protein LJR030_003124 [Rhizobium sp. LjRoot30]|uniref:hypothetical protein n=1 Tax=Rhizobium sp. LjRoot30 TaxID=3342320 RepID=UPI003ECE5B3E
MNERACSIPTPEQRQYLSIRETAERAMLDKVTSAIEAAPAEVAQKFKDAGLDFEPTSKDYFTFTVQQVAFVMLSGGDLETFRGGDPDIGERVVRNCRHIIDHYWREDGEPASASACTDPSEVRRD